MSIIIWKEMMLYWIECAKIASLFFIKIIQKMGNDNKRSEFDEENWEILSTNSTKTILKNRLTHSLLDLYQCDEDSESLLSKRARDLYEWRKNLSIHLHIPVLYHYQVETPLLGSAQHQKIFTEHLTKFIQLPPISKQQSFLILEQIITVLPFLYKQFGLFHANVYTVAFNDAGVTKVWINENVAKNSVEPEDIIKKPSQNLQLSIVNNLVRMVKTKVYNEEIKPDYPFSLNFLETLKLIKETRQKWIDYDLTQVYFNRNEFNQKYQVGVNQRFQQVPNVAAFPIKTEAASLVAEVSMAAIKTVPNKQQTNLMNPLPYQSISNPHFYQNNYALPTFERQNNIPIHFYTPHPNQFPYSSFDKNIRANMVYNVSNNPANFPILSGEKIHEWRKIHNQHASMQPTHKQQPLLQQSYYISAPQIPRVDSPTKQKKSFSPIKAFKGLSNQARIPNIISPRRQENLITDFTDRPPYNQNRPISLSPSKKRPIKEEFKYPEAAIQKPVWIRPVSSNNYATPKKQLSRIVEQEQSRFDSFYIKNLQKKSIPDSQDGFNVQMVESIYVKTNQTQEGV